MKLAPLALVVFGCSMFAATPSRAQAAPDQPSPGPGGVEYAGQLVYERGYLIVDRVDTVAPDPSVAAAPPSRVLYLNNCKAGGCAITPGNFTRADDSRTNLSSIVQGSSPRTLSAYTGSDTTWNAIVACVRENYAPFNIQIVTTEPPSNTSYFEAFAAGLPGNLGFPSNVAGVASANCGVIPNAISFSFLNLPNTSVTAACWTISQESAHNFGLGHEMLGTDAMTYINAPARKRFINQTACMGTQGCCAPTSECRCGPTEQNSYQSLLAIFGAAGATPPTIVIETPITNESVLPGFVVRAVVTDDVGVAQVELLVDGTPTASLTSGPFAFNAPASISPGPHQIGIRATDTTGADATATVNINVGEPCTGDEQCAVVGEGFVCVGGRCVAGSSVPGGLGEPCDGPTDCLSTLCVTKGGENKCSETCDTGVANSCTASFQCIDNPAGGGVCWPGADETCGGCDADGGAGPTWPIGAGLLLSALLLRRRRRAA